MNLTVQVLHVARNVVAFMVAQFPHSRLPLQTARLCEDVARHWPPVGFSQDAKNTLPLCFSIFHLALAQRFFGKTRLQLPQVIFPFGEIRCHPEPHFGQCLLLRYTSFE